MSPNEHDALRESGEPAADLSAAGQAVEDHTEAAPETGHPVVDAALRDFGSLDDHPRAEHHDRLAQVQEVLASVLENRAGQTTLPGTPPRPGPR